MTEYVYLADGRKVPVPCVDALWKFEEIWPGASLPQARAAIAWAVIDALKTIELKERVKFTVKRDELFVIQPDLISVIHEELRQNVIRDMLNKNDN